MTKEYDIKTLKTFRDKEHRTAWLSPAGNLYPVEYYQHLNFFVERDYGSDEGYKINPNVPSEFPTEILDQIKEKLVNYQETVDVEYKRHCDSIPEGEHPEMHVVEIWESGFRHDTEAEIRDIISNAGWGRLGLYNHKGEGKMELDCIPYHLINLRYFSEEIATLLNVELTFTRITGVKS